MSDHADPSVLEEHTIPVPCGHDHPVLDASWAGNITIAAVDEAAEEWKRARGEFIALCASLNYPIQPEPPTDIHLAKTILRLLVAKGLAPQNANLSWQCIESLTLSPWIWNRFEEHGIRGNWGEIIRRRNEEKKKA